MRNGPRSVRFGVAIATAFVAATTMLTPAAVSAAGSSGTASPATGGQPIAFGADLKPATNQTLQQTITSFETTTGRKLAYTRDYLLWDSPFPTSYEQWLAARGTVPFISVYPKTAAGVRTSWASIASAQPGDPVYTQMVSWADRIKAFGYPVYFAFNHEPEAAASLTEGSNTDFIAAWQNFHRVFDAEHVTNARWIWTMTAYAFTVNSSDRRWGQYWYPGDAYVDALGADAYTAYTCDNATGIWHNLAYQIAGFTAFGAQHPSKPLWLPEWGVVEDSAQPGRKAQFISEAQALFKGPGYSQYAGIAYFDETRPGTACVWDVSSSTSAQTAYNTMAHDSFYSGSAAWTPPDTTPPTVSITAPASGTLINAPTTVTATAADNIGVASVAFSVDGSLLSTDTTAPYAATVDPATLPPGTHTVTAVARDAANNTTTSAPITLTVPQPNPDTTPPTVAITAPADGALVSGTVTVRANASDDKAVASVAFAVDGATLSTATSAPYSASLDTSTLAVGNHALTATAVDTSNNSTTSATITITVSPPPPDTTPPTVSITSPTDGTTISGATTINANASDDVAVASVGFFLDGTLISTATSAPYSASINAGTLSSGPHTLTAVATDTSSNPTTSAPISVSVPAPDTTPPTVSITSPTDGTTISGATTINANASDDVAVASVGFFLDGTLISTATSAPYSASINAASMSTGSHSLTAVATDTSSNPTTSAVVHITVAAAPPPPTHCAATPAGSTELSTNLSLETNQNGWTGQYNSTSLNTRVQVSGGSYDGNWAMQIGPKSGNSGIAGLNNVSPYWVTNTVANRTYTGSAVVRTAVSGLPVTVLVRETTSSGSAIGYANKTITLSDTAWHPISVAYKAKNAGDQIRYGLYATFPSSGTSMLGDCLSLQSTP